MEARVWSDPRVQQILRDDYVLVALYTDDKTKVPENEWVTTAGGKVLKDIGRINSYIAQTRFGVNGQPNYLILGRDGRGGSQAGLQSRRGGIHRLPEERCGGV